MHRVANLAALQATLVTFFPFKKAPKPYLASSNRQYCHASKRSYFPGLYFSVTISLFILLSDNRNHKIYQ